LTKIYNLELQFNRSYQLFTFSTPNFSFSRLSTGIKLASKTPKKIQKSVHFRFRTGTKSSKTAQKNFSKNRQNVFSTRYQF
jgi:hypothetical protein